MAALTVARWIASGLGSGHAPRAPGTAGSLVALGIGAAVLAWSPWALAGAAGIEGDPGWVVIDEFAGQWIALLALPRPSWLGLAVAFALFRLLDITKPGPVGWADRQHGAVGVMADDVIAGALAAGLVLGLRWAAPTLL